jgi:hypothetical protein
LAGAALASVTGASALLAMMTSRRKPWSPVAVIRIALGGPLKPGLG